MERRQKVLPVFLLVIFLVASCTRIITPAGAKTVWLPIKSCT
jgi:hypothetical protein